MEQFSGALSNLSRGAILVVFVVNMRNEEFRKQLCMETLLPSDASQFAVVREMGKMMYTKVSGILPKFERNKFTPSRLNTEGSQQPGYIKPEPVNDVKGQRQDKCHNCGSWSKPNNKEHCPARNIIF